MPSSTSSSETPRLERGLRLRLLAVLVLVPSLGVGSFQVAGTPGDLPETTFWAQKSLWSASFDLVIAGDSRAYQGISPDEMGSSFPQSARGNFGFQNAVLTPAYLNRVRSLISRDAPDPMIVLALTPHSLTMRHADFNGFTDWRAREHLRLLALPAFGWLNQFFKRLSVFELAVMVRDRSMFVGASYFEDGWVAGRHGLPVDVQSDFQENEISEELVDSLIEIVGEWTEGGVRVFALLMPSSPSVHELEITLSGLDVDSLEAKLGAAGAVWLNPSGRYESYDGSHFTALSARMFSRWLGVTIASW